jgi:hypothetical protein
MQPIETSVEAGGRRPGSEASLFVRSLADCSSCYTRVSDLRLFLAPPAANQIQVLRRNRVGSNWVPQNRIDDTTT